MTIITSALLMLLLAASAPASSAGSVPAVHPDSALAQLREGNRRFVAGTSVHASHADRRAETARGQHPLAVVIGCADSRAAPELLFDQGIGDIFVIRTAGNLADEHALGSIEYAVRHLGVRLLVVMGHQRCGAVTAAMGEDPGHGHIRALVRDIRPAVTAAKDIRGDALKNAVRENARMVASGIRDSANLETAAPGVRVVTAYYDLETGVVTWHGE